MNKSLYISVKLGECPQSESTVSARFYHIQHMDLSATTEYNRALIIIYIILLEFMFFFCNIVTIGNVKMENKNESNT